VITADGQHVAFDSFASDLVVGGTNGAENMFVRDLSAPTPELVSVNSTGTAGGNADSYRPAISADGQTVAFVSNATNLVRGFVKEDGPGNPDVFARDRPDARTALVSASLAGPTTTGNRYSDQPVLNAGGNPFPFVVAAFAPDSGRKARGSRRMAGVRRIIIDVPSFLICPVDPSKRLSFGISSTCF
jgi:hypothetical protein